MREISFEIKVPEFNFSQTTKNGTRIFLSLVIFFLVFWASRPFDFSLLEMFIWDYFFLSILWRLPVWISAAAALVFLAAIPVLMLYQKPELAEGLAKYAYYFLLMTVVAEIISLKSEKKEEEAQSANPPSGRYPMYRYSIDKSPVDRYPVDRYHRRARRKIV